MIAFYSFFPPLAGVQRKMTYKLEIEVPHVYERSVNYLYHADAAHSGKVYSHSVDNK